MNPLSTTPALVPAELTTSFSNLNPALPSQSTAPALTELEWGDETQSEMRKLEDLLQNFPQENWPDPLSQKIFRWGAKTALSVKTQEQLKLRIEKLLKQILINPFAPILQIEPRLSSPLLVGNWAWEEANLRDYLAFSSISPFDQQPLSLAQAKPHFLALALLSWANSLQAEEMKSKVATLQPLSCLPAEKEDGEQQLTHLSLNTPKLLRMKSLLYQMQAKKVALICQTRQFKWEMQEGSKIMANETKKIEGHVLQLSQEREEKEKEQESWLKERMKQMQLERGESIDNLQNVVAATNDHTEMTVNAIEVAQSQTIPQQASEIQNLTANIARLNSIMNEF